MANVKNNISSEWDDEDESTQLYQPRMLQDARAALDSLGSFDPVSEVHTAEEPETWFISADGQQKQPLSAGEVVDRCRAGTLSEQTLVWHEGLDDWTRLSDVPELRRILGALAHRDAGAPRNLPPLPSPPLSSRAAASNSFPLKPAPAASASGTFESDATQVYGGTAIRLKAALSRSEPTGQLSEVKAAAVQSRQLAYGNRRLRLITLAAAAGICFTAGALLFHRDAGGVGAQLAEYNLDATTGQAGAADDGSAAALNVLAASKPVTAAAAPQSSAIDEPEEMHADGERATAEQDSHSENAPGLAEAVAEKMSSRSQPASDQAARPTRTGSRRASHRDFDEAAARSAMALAAQRARNCRPKGGPRGSGQVSVRIEPSGTVSGATILTSKFEGTVAGSCIRMLFRQASIPAFSGPAKTVVQRFSVPE